MELKPDLPGAHALYGQILRSLAEIDRAEEQFREELKVNPYDYFANTEVAMQLKQEGKVEEARAHLQRALQVRPEDPGALHQIALLDLTQGRAEQARETLERVVREHPDFAEAHAALATAYYKLNRKAEGDREREAARRVQEENERRLEEKLKGSK